MEDISNETFKAELEKIRKAYKRASDILQNIEDFSGRFEDAKKLLNDPNEGIETNSEIVKKKRQEIDTLYNQSQGTVNQITENLEKIRVQIESMQVAYNDFSEIKGKVSGKSGEIEQVAESAKGLKSDIEKGKSNVESILETIN